MAVIDGLGPELLDRTIAAGRAPNLARLQQLGSRTDTCVSTFPSLTPVCLSALITGSHPAGSGIPSMTWYRPRRGPLRRVRIVVLATLAEGTKRDGRRRAGQPQPAAHVAAGDNGVRGARGRRPGDGLRQHVRLPRPGAAPDQRGRRARRIARRVGIVDAFYGPKRFFFGELFWSDDTGAPRNFGGSVDRHRRQVGRWLVTRDGFDFLFLLPVRGRHRAASRRGRGADEVEQADSSLGLMVDAAGGWDAFLERYAHRGRRRPLPDDRGARRGRHRTSRGPRAASARAATPIPTNVTSRSRPATGLRWPTCCPQAG